MIWKALVAGGYEKEAGESEGLLEGVMKSLREARGALNRILRRHEGATIRVVLPQYDL